MVGYDWSTSHVNFSSPRNLRTQDILPQWAPNVKKRDKSSLPGMITLSRFSTARYRLTLS